MKFSTVLKFEETVFLFIYQRPFLLKISYLKGLISVKIWVSIFGALIIISCVFTVTLKLSFWKIVTLLLKSSLEQPVIVGKILLNHKASFSLLASWWLFIMIINVVFKSRLTAHMIYPRVPPPTLDELLSEGYNFVGDKNRLSFYQQVFSDEEKSLFLKSTNMQKNNVCELAVYIETHKSILAGEKSRNLYHTKLFCSHYYQKPPQNLELFSAKTFVLIPYAWAFRLGTPFVDSFNSGIKQMMSGGFLKVWEREAFLNKEFRKYRKNSSRNNTRIESDAFLMVCLLHLGALFGSLVVFFIELSYFALKKRNTMYD
nr:PREDICTED: uncharacterized protein LOC107398477 [Tribolium castaneum]|eukprot:XP_015838136.1 PREDICTED: uncharacterized protein LOC107398477 [Tribolium castaneum]